MASFGEVERLDHAIFADTGWEPAAVYEHLERLKAVAPCPVHVVSVGNIRDDHVDPQTERLFVQKSAQDGMVGRQHVNIPFFTRNPDGGGGMIGRRCTQKYKIEPIETKIREIVGLKPRQHWPYQHLVDQIVGISWDETERVRDAARPAFRNIYPLVDKHMTRQDCKQWLTEHGWTAPRSACIGCPYHHNREWDQMKRNDPHSWADAVDFDNTMRERARNQQLYITTDIYLHPQRVPLHHADLDTDNPDLEQECQGMCGH